MIKLAVKERIITKEKAIEMAEFAAFEDRCLDILEWGKYYFPDKFTLPFCEELHRYLIDIAQEPLTNTLAPRGHAKTTIKCFLIPIYYALNQPWKYRHYLNVQSTSTKAVSVNLSIRYELETNELLRRDYGDLVSAKKWTEKQFVLTNGVIFTALGVGDSVRGINYSNTRPDNIILDDIYDEDDIENPRLIDKKNRWFWGAIYKAVANDRPICIHIQGTAINKNDLMHILQKRERWKFAKFQSYDPKTNEVLWKEANTLEKLLQDKSEMGSIIFEREMQNNIRDDETAIIKQSWIKYFGGVIPEGEKIIDVRLNVDPAVGQKEINDSTAKSIIYKTDLGNYYIFELGNDHMTFDENIRDMESFSIRHSLNVLRLEAIAAFKGLAQEIRRRTSLPLKEISAVKDKISRLIAVSALFENGKVYISDKIPEKLRNELVDQLTTNMPPHDDLRDCVVLGLEDYSRDLYFGVA